MRAVIVAHAAVKAANRRTYRALAARGVDVTVVVPDTWQTGFGPVRAEPEPAGSDLDVRVRPRRGLSHSNVYWLGGALEPLLAGARGERAIYVDEDPAGFAAAQAARAAAASGAGLVVLGIQNLVKRYPPPFGALQRFVFARAQAAVSISAQATSALRARGYRGPAAEMPFSTALVPLDPAERAALRARYAGGGPLAGYVGRLVPEKGVDVFLAALAGLPEVRGLIVGDGPERAFLERRAAELGLGARVRFTGALAPDEAARALGALDVLALPSRTRRNWAEQFGRVLIEAMASGVAVVASDSGAIGEVVGEAGLLVPEDDPAALARALAGALEPGLGAALRARGLARARTRFHPQAETDALHGALRLAATTAAETRRC